MKVQLHSWLELVMVKLNISYIATNVLKMGRSRDLVLLCKKIGGIPRDRRVQQ